MCWEPKNKDLSFQLNVGGAAQVQDQAAYHEDGPDFEPQDNEAFEVNLRKSTCMPLDLNKKRKTESQKKDDEELLILRNFATSAAFRWSNWIYMDTQGHA